MNPTEQNKEYWTNYWTDNPMFEVENPQSQVARTVLKVPIDDTRWQYQLNEIETVLHLDSQDSLLDLCAGNGLIAMPFSLKCKSVTAVDISRTLLEKINMVDYPAIDVIVGDVRDVMLPKDTYSKGLMYGALQYFSEREAISIFDTIRQAMQRKGIFLVGDILDIDHLFDFYNKPEWVKGYYDSLKAGTPALGTWFKKDILYEMARYVGFRNVEVLIQPAGLINSHYRFDLLLTK